MKNIVWGYARVSTAEQNEARQIAALKGAGVEERHLIIDKVSGKDFQRTGYQYLMDRLSEGDVLIIMSIDRLGRNYEDIKQQWQIITREKRVGIKVLDMPLLDTTKSSGDLDSTFIADLVLQILSYVAAKERENIRKRQRQGIDLMPLNDDGVKVSLKTGRTAGRPRTPLPYNWNCVYSLWKSGEITAVEAAQRVGMKIGMFYANVQRVEGRYIIRKKDPTE